MPTGACGINCDVCQLNLLDLCSTCGGGRSDEARLKLDAQKRIMGSPCPVLSCAVLNHKNYCLRDCSQYPCENYQMNAYPFSASFLQMQARRRKNPTNQIDPMGKPVTVPMAYWDEIQKRDFNLLGALTQAEVDNQGGLTFLFLNQQISLDMGARILVSSTGEKIDNPIFERIVLVYFKSIDRLYPVGKEMISPKDMEQSFYFEGRNRLKTEPVLRRFQDSPKALTENAEKLGGKSIDLADEAVVLYPFPRIPVYYLLWESQEEYESRVSILFDRSIESVFDPPLIWGLVNVLNSYLLTV